MSLLALTKLSRFVAALFDECKTDEEAEAILKTLPEDKQQLIIRLNEFYATASLFKLMEIAQRFDYEDTEFLDSQVIDIFKKLTPFSHSSGIIIRHIAEDKRPRFEMLEFMCRAHFIPETINNDLHLFIRYGVMFENIALLEKLNEIFGVKNIYDRYNERPRPWYEHPHHTGDKYIHRDYTIRTTEDKFLGEILIKNNCSINMIEYCLKNITRCSRRLILKRMISSGKPEYIKFIMSNYAWLYELFQKEGSEIRPTGVSDLDDRIVRYLAEHPEAIPCYVENGFDIHEEAERIIYMAFQHDDTHDMYIPGLLLTIRISKMLLDILATYNINIDVKELASRRHSGSISIVIE